MAQLFQRGGPLMWALLACSVFGLGVVIERLWAFRRAKRDHDQLLKAVEEAVNSEGAEAGVRVCQTTGGPVAAVMAAGLAKADQGADPMRESMEAALSHQSSLLERYLPALATIANVAPLIGFLGTVLGMIQAFDRIAEAGLGDPKIVGGGISQALITTATGLMVAIPAFIAHSYFISRADEYAQAMEQSAHRVQEIAGQLEESRARAS